MRLKAYTFGGNVINPQGNPRAAGFPFRLHVTVRIFSKDRVKPNAPEALTAEVASSSRIDLRWTDKSDDEEMFKINRFWKGSWTVIAEVGPDATTFSDTELPPGKFYSYAVKAYNLQEGNSYKSNVASGRTLKTPPPMPGDFTAAVIAADKIYLHWTDKSDDESHFEILRSADGIDFNYEIVVPANQTSYVDSNLVSGATYYYKIRAVQPRAEAADYTGPLRIAVFADVATAIRADAKGAPPAFVLHGNYPNPFNAATAIRFILPGRGKVALGIYDIAGHLVRELLGHPLASGRHEVEWDGRDDNGRELASGVYLYRLRVGERVRTRKLLMLR